VIITTVLHAIEVLQDSAGVRGGQQVVPREAPRPQRGIPRQLLLRARVRQARRAIQEGLTPLNHRGEDRRGKDKRPRGGAVRDPQGPGSPEGRGHEDDDEETGGSRGGHEQDPARDR